MSPDAITSIDPFRRSQSDSVSPPGEEFTFSDALDVINPLQHIPVVGWIYREITGDTMGVPASIAGGALFGGPLGFAGSILAAAFESLTGESPEEILAEAFSSSKARQGIAAYERAFGLAEG